MMQHAVTFEIELSRDRDLDALRGEARALGNPAGPDGGPPWAGLSGLHFASVVVISDDPEQTYPSRPPGPPLAPVLVIELSFDGDRMLFLNRFVECARGVLDTLLADAPQYPGRTASAADVLGFLVKRDIGADAFYIGAPGRTVEQIQAEASLRAKARESLDPDSFPDTREAYWERLEERLQETLRQLAPRMPALPARVLFSLRFLRGPKRIAQWMGFVAWGASLVAGLVFFGDLIGLYSLGDRPVGGGVLSAVGLLGGALWIAGLAIAGLRERSAHVRASMRQQLLWVQLRQVGACAASVAVALGVLHALRFSGVLGSVAACGLALVLCLWAMALAVVTGTLAYAAGGSRVGVSVAGFSLAACVIGGWTASSLSQLTWLLTLLSLGIALVVGGALAAFFYALGRREFEESVDPTGWDVEHLAQMRQREDLQYQNHFASVTWIKPGAFRMRVLQAVLRVVHVAASVVFTLGDLGGIASIHFARFVILRDRRRLLFLTNYDGPWDGYLDDFVSVPGVTAVWGNSAGFPRPFLLVGDGARDEQRFKAYARASQVETLAWYSAYPNLSVGDVSAGTETRLDLLRPVERPLAGWRGVVWRRLMRPLDPAALDLAIRRL